MHRFILFSFSLLITCCLLLSINLSTSAAANKSPLQMTVSILPQEYFVKRIGGDKVEVTTLVQPGHSPATYAPTPQQMAAIASSKIYFRIGVPFENSLLPKLERSLPSLTIIDLRTGIDLLVMEDEHDEDHGHNGDFDPHTWLDPRLAIQQAKLIRDTLIRIDPAKKMIYSSNFDLLADDLNQLDRQLRDLLQPLAGRTIYVFHPAYGYFCRAYGLKQKAIHPDGKDPGARYLARLIEQAKNDNVKVIFVQPQFSMKAARTLAQSIGGSVIALDPLGKDYLSNMQAMADQLIQSLSINEQ